MILQISTSIYCFFAIQCMFWIREVLRSFAQKLSENERQMLTFLSLYVLANSVWLLSMAGMFSGIFSELLLIGSSFAIVVYTLSLWRSVYGLNLHNHGLIVHAAIFTFLFSRLNQAEIQSFETWEIVLVVTYGEVIALYYAGRIFKLVLLGNQVSDSNTTSILVSSGVLCVLPLLLFVIQTTSLKYVFANLHFIVMLIAYIRTNNFQKNNLHELPEIQEAAELNLQKSKLSLFDWNYSERKLELYKKQLAESLERNTQLEQEAEEKAKIIEKYERRSENTIESVLAQYDITPRQLEVLKLMMEGKTTQEIAEELFIESSSTRCHLSAVYRKTGVVGVKELRRFIQDKLDNS